jgi:hypothetical protein
MSGCVHSGISLLPLNTAAFAALRRSYLLVSPWLAVALANSSNDLALGSSIAGDRHADDHHRPQPAEPLRFRERG